jgi:hypothetical protein
MAAAVILSLVTKKNEEQGAVLLSDINFRTQPVFNILGICVTAILVGLYAFLW